MPEITPNHIEELILSCMQHPATADQATLITKLADFLSQKDPSKIFLLKGFAGTGKTTLVSAFVEMLSKIGWHSVLLGPTGRAAKVLSNYCRKPAQTIHKKIYFPNVTPEGYLMLEVKQNKHKNTIFFVDEASMIPDSENNNRFGNYTGRNLLVDLVEFVYNRQNCVMILVGDTAQLPPVGLEISPALDADNIRNAFSLHLTAHELTHVVRQAEDSQILRNATKLRTHIQAENFHPPFFYNQFSFDFQRLSGYDLEDELNTAYSKYGSEEVAIISRSNKRANMFNNQIRLRIYGRDEQIVAGDQIMIVKNNYFWLPESSAAGFIANGDMATVEKITKIEDRYGFRFADARIRLIDYPTIEALDVKLALDTLNSESPALPWEQYRTLFSALQEEYFEIPSRSKRMEAIRNNPYFNALQIKFSYALTCHKTQGGQWKCVFVDQGWLIEKNVNKEFLRWLYTAATRATEQLFLVNFSDWLF